MKYRFDKANEQQQFEGLPPPEPGSIEALDTYLRLFRDNH